MKALDELIRFQTDKKLDEMRYDGINEATSSLEELLEGLGYDVPKHKRMSLKIAFELFIGELELDGTAKVVAITEHDIVDSIADSIVFDIGKLLKLGYNPYLVIEEVGKEINSRKGNIIDGKWVKDSKQDKSTLYKANYENCKQ